MALAVAASTPAIAQADRGGALALDRSFGNDGVATAPAGGKANRDQNGIAAAPGGKIVVGLDAPEALLRFTASGHRDRSFGAAGYARLRARGHRVDPQDVLVDRKGRATAFGASLIRSEPDSLYGGGIIRLGRDGKVDRGFSDRGLFLPKIATSFEFREAAFAPGGRIVAVARGFNRRSGRTLVTRLLPNGRPDRSFSGDGFRLLRLGDQYREVSVAVDKRGRIVVGSGSGGGIAVVRLAGDGGLDKSFGGTGRVIPRTPHVREGLSDLTVDKRGRIVLAGGTTGTPGLVTRITGRGDLDRSFSGDGYRRLPRLENPTSVSVDDMGRINVVGYDFDGFSDFQSVVNRMRPGGAFDPTGSAQDCGGFCSYDLGRFGDHYLDSKNRLVISTASGRPSVVRLLNR